VHLPHEIILNADLMQQGDFINVFLARHVSGTYGNMLYWHSQSLWLIVMQTW